MPQLAAIKPAYIEQVLRGALGGSHVQQWELFDLMEDTWPRLKKNLNELKRAVQKLDWQVHPWSEEDMPPDAASRERAAIVSNAVWRMKPEINEDSNDFKGTIYDILDAWSKGIVVLETDWVIRPTSKHGDITMPRTTTWVHPCSYGWDDSGFLGLQEAALQQASQIRGTSYYPSPTYALQGAILPFPEHKFLVAICKSKSASVLGAAMLRPLAWWWCVSNFAGDWLMNLAQLFGLPFRWANYTNGASQETINKVSAALQNMGSAGWAAFPEGTILDLKEAGARAGDSPQESLLDRADKNCDLLVLGQTLTTEQGRQGSQALGNVHADIRMDVIISAGEWAASIINRQLIPSILMLNYGDTDQAPEFRVEVETEEDQKANADRDKVLLDAGVEMPKDWFYKRHDIPLPSDGEEVIGGKPEPIPGQPVPAEKPNEPATARATTPASFLKKATTSLSAALANDVEPMLKRLAAILKIQDDVVFAHKMRVWLAEYPQLKRDSLADPSAAHELEKIIGTSVANGIAQGK